MSDYRKVNGIWFAHLTIQRVMNIDTYIQIHSIRHNIQMPAHQFEPPEQIQSLLETSKEKDGATEK